MTRYILVGWPECQKFQEDGYIEHCYCCCDDNGTILFVPEDLYFKVINDN